MNEETEVEEAQSANQHKSSIASNDGNQEGFGWWESQGGKIAKAVKDVNFDAGLEIASPDAIR